MADRLEGMGIVVTGATKGLGRETALLMAAEGARVVAVGRDAADGASLEAEGAELPGSIAFHAPSTQTSTQACA
ncbi:MAG: SDR family oxidoreductase, partial [Thermoleophilia bacterium]|nr:SDR family oxidoreductase [Thermoleophilia bacterium]